MRTFVAIVLILAGTALAAAPIASDYAQSLRVRQAATETRVPGESSFIRQPLSESYQLGCWILGGAMICLGIIGGVRQPTLDGMDDSHNPYLAHAAG